MTEKLHIMKEELPNLVLNADKLREIGIANISISGQLFSLDFLEDLANLTPSGKAIHLTGIDATKVERKLYQLLGEGATHCSDHLISDMHIGPSDFVVATYTMEFGYKLIAMAATSVGVKI